MSLRYMVNGMPKSKIVLSRVNQTDALYVIFLALGFAGIALEALFGVTGPALLSYVAYICYLVIKKPLFVVKYFYIVFMISTNVFGVYAIETASFYLPELGLTSHYAGSFPLIVAYHFFFLVGLCIFDRTNSRRGETVRLPKGKEKWVNAFLVFSIVLLILFVSIALTNPFFDNGADRFSYAQGTLLQRALGTFSGYAVYLVPLAVLGFQIGFKAKALGVIGLCALLGFLTGNKFGIFLLLAYTFVLGLYPLIKKMSRNRLMQSVFGICALVIIFLSITFMHNALNYGYSLDKNLEYLNQRLAQQGELWWRTYDLENAATSKDHFDEIDDELAAWFNTDADPSSGSYGIYKTMLIDIPYPSMFYEKIETGSRYAYSTPSSIYYYFGPIGMMVFAVVVAFFYSMVVNAVIKAMSQGKVLRSIILIKFLILSNQVLVQSDFDLLMSWETLGFLAFYAIICVLERRTQAKAVGEAR